MPPHIADLFENGASDAALPANTELPLDIVPLPIDPDREAAEDDPPWNLLEERRLDPRRASAWGYERTSAWRVSTTDPDATPKRSGTRTTFGYHDHYGVDGANAASSSPPR
jgi:hypothetical protein